MIKKVTLFILIMISNAIFACDCLDFTKATKKALVENKFILAHFGDGFNVNENGKGYLKIEGLNKEDEEIFNTKFVYVCIPNFSFDEKKQKYNVSDSSGLLILDALGTELYRFTKDDNDFEVYKILNHFLNSIPNLSIDLSQFKKKKNYYSGVRVAQKYFDFAIDKESNIREPILKAANNYLESAKTAVKKSDKLYNVKIQNYNLNKIYAFAFSDRFDVINERISIFQEKEIDQENKSLFYFLKYLSSKKMKRDEAFIEEKFKSTENYDYFSKKVNLF